MMQERARSCIRGKVQTPALVYLLLCGVTIYWLTFAGNIRTARVLIDSSAGKAEGGQRALLLEAEHCQVRLLNIL
jgi:hypothetical protein